MSSAVEPGETRTLVCYESSHRIRDCIADMVIELGSEREATLARELTKVFETVRSGTLGELAVWLQAAGNRQKGEFVVVVQGAPEAAVADAETARHVLEVLLAELPLKQAAALAARITGISRNALYEQGVVLKEGQKGL